MITNFFALLRAQNVYGYTTFVTQKVQITCFRLDKNHVANLFFIQ